MARGPDAYEDAGSGPTAARSAAAWARATYLPENTNGITKASTCTAVSGTVAEWA